LSRPIATVPAGPEAASTPPSAWPPLAMEPPTLTEKRSASVRLPRRSWRTSAVCPEERARATAGAWKSPTAVTVAAPPSSTASVSRTWSSFRPLGAPEVVFVHPLQARLPSQATAWRTMAVAEPAVKT
jgi:hypothetical protein